ncbi:restriction endonuclease subunit S [Isoptericola variabilis]|uniref:Restriction modification system DNA specificity domain protein n=1 Tax=Isoptericola variabilis (strain 225) TaxID=743718 RepID=F6FPE4_ISOV2|nr:restriction endonuclease subunit S [Isoptericola variabilis]AEG43657.1 restriction modification system DNA specificity domain protein [Isoptericola variabilis 225]TWH27338.1 type I restriction enzyme S subunit [Isoptericola variabilis J7]
MAEPVTIGELARRGVLTFGDGYRTKRSEHGQPGYRIIRVADVRDSSVYLDGDDFVSASFAVQMGSKIAHAGDVLLTTKGTVGRVAVMPPHDEPAVYSPQLCYFRIHERHVLDPAYLRYWFDSAEFVGQASYLQGNSDMAPYISLTDLKGSRITLPPIEVQRAIAEVLGALDDKIAANTRLANAADALATVKFTAANRGDKKVVLSAMARFVNGRNFTKAATGQGRAVIRIAELNSGISGSTVWNDVEAQEDNVARAGDLLFAWSGSLTLRRWYLDEGVVNQHIFKVIPNEGYPLWLVHQVLQEKLQEFRDIAADKATTMGHIQRKHLDVPVRVPAQEEIAAMDPGMTALWQRALSAEREREALAALRDALLPALMSGRLRVRDAEQMVEDAAPGQSSVGAIVR